MIDNLQLNAAVELLSLRAFKAYGIILTPSYVKEVISTDMLMTGAPPPSDAEIAGILNCGRNRLSPDWAISSWPLLVETMTLHLSKGRS